MRLENPTITLASVLEAILCGDLHTAEKETRNLADHFTACLETDRGQTFPKVILLGPDELRAPSMAQLRIGIPANPHYFAAMSDDSDTCRECGSNIRNEIHFRVDDPRKT